MWLIALIFLPFLTAVVYLIAKGPGIAQRQARGVEEMRREQDAYIKQVAGFRRVRPTRSPRPRRCSTHRGDRGPPWAGTSMESCIQRSFVGEIIVPFEGDPLEVPYDVKIPEKKGAAVDPKKPGKK